MVEADAAAATPAAPDLALLTPSKKEELAAAATETLTREWSGLLYKPSFASQLSQNACYDPAIARALDQCGGLREC